MGSKPVQIEVVAHVWGSMNHCLHCQIFIDGVGVGGRVKQADLEAYPREFMAEWRRLSNWILTLAERYTGQVVIKIIDAQSLSGLWKALRHGVRKYPAFLIEGEKYQGWEAEGDFMARLIQCLEAQAQSVAVEMEA